MYTTSSCHYMPFNVKVQALFTWIFVTCNCIIKNNHNITHTTTKFIVRYHFYLLLTRRGMLITFNKTYTLQNKTHVEKLIQK